jgi:hypothetical protein
MKNGLRDIAIIHLQSMSYVLCDTAECNTEYSSMVNAPHLQVELHANDGLAGHFQHEVAPAGSMQEPLASLIASRINPRHRHCHYSFH